MSTQLRPPTATEDYLTVAEVALLLKVSRWTVYELIRTQELASFKLGRCRRIPAAAVHEMAARLIAQAA